MTRSFVAIMQGDLTRAFRLHPLGPLVFVACLAAVGDGLYVAMKGERATFVERIIRQRWMIAVFVAALVGVWVARLI